MIEWTNGIRTMLLEDSSEFIAGNFVNYSKMWITRKNCKVIQYFNNGELPKVSSMQIMVFASTHLFRDGKRTKPFKNPV